MHITNLPLVGSSFLFILPYYTAVFYKNYFSAAAWGFLTCTSTLVHITKQPFHLYGHGNCIPWLYNIDVFALYVCILATSIDSFYGGPMAILINCTFLMYGGIAFYYGKQIDKFVYDKHMETSILSHMSVHMMAAFGGIAVLCLRQLNLSDALSCETSAYV